MTETNKITIDRENNIANILCESENLGLRIAKIDLEDLRLIEEYHWSMCQRKYVFTYLLIRGKRKKIYIEKMLLGTKKLIDHIDRNPANNCKSNLRIANSRINVINRGAFKNSKSGIRGIQKIKNKDGSFFFNCRANYKKKFFRKCFSNYLEGFRELEAWRRKHMPGYVPALEYDETNNANSKKS